MAANDGALVVTIVPSSNQAASREFAAISADGRYTVNRTSSGGVVVSEFPSGKVLLEGLPDYRAMSAAISPDGQWLFASGASGARLWHIPSKRIITSSSLPSEARDIQFSPDGTRLAIAGIAKIVVVDCRTGREIGHFLTSQGNHGPYPNHLAFSPDGKKLFAQVGNGDVYRLSAETLKPLGDPWLGIGAMPTQIAFSPDSRYVAVTRRLHNSTQVVVIDAISGALLSSPAADHRNDDQEQAVTFTPDGRHLITASIGGIVTLWESATGEMVAQKSLSQPYLVHLRFDQNAKRLYSLERGIVWDISIRNDVPRRPTNSTSAPPVVLPTGSNFRDFVAEAHIGIESAEFHSGSGLLVIGGGSALHMVDGDRIRYIPLVIRPVPPPESREGPTGIVSVSISRDGRRVTAGPDYKAMGVYDVATGKLVSMVGSSVEYATEYGRPHCFLHDGQIAIPSKDGVRIVDASKGTTVHRLPLKLDGDASAIGAARGIPLMAIGTSKGSLLLAGTRGTASTKILSHIHNGPILTIAFSPNDQTIATGGVDGAIRLIDAKTGRPMETAWAAHVDAVTALGVSPDGKYVASGSAGGTIRVWNVTTGLPVTHELVSHAQPVLAIMFDVSAGQVVSVGRDSTLRRWTIPIQVTRTP